MPDSFVRRVRSSIGNRLIGLAAGLTIAVFGLLVGPIQIADAATVTVTNANDTHTSGVTPTGDGVSLREAINSINQG